MRILALWDDDAQIPLLKLYLSVEDNELTVVQDPAEFLQHVDSQQTYDVILTAISHPTFEDAQKTFARIIEARPECPVVGACPQGDAYRVAGFMAIGLRNYFLRDPNGDFMFLLVAILQAAVKQVETERERLVAVQLRKEVESVRELQESIIRGEIQTPEGYGIVARYESSQIRVLGSKPVTMAGGDYYEAFTLPDDRMVVLVGDASGHGMKACMSIFTMHTLIRMIRFDDYLDAGKLVSHINSELCKQSVVSGKGGFITMLYGVFDPKTRELCWASAGHQMPLVHDMQTDEIYEIADAEDASGLPIGIFEEGDYPTNRHIIPPTSRLMLYTDGLIEAFPGNNRGEHEEFGMEGVYRTLRTAKDKSLADCLDLLFSESYAFTQGSGRHDDTSVLLLESE